MFSERIVYAVASLTLEHMDDTFTLRCLYSKRLDSRLVDITAMQEVTAGKESKTHKSLIPSHNANVIKTSQGDSFTQQRGNIISDLQKMRWTAIAMLSSLS